MTNPNPVETIGGITTTANVPKADVVSWAKSRVAQLMADAAEVNNTDLAGQLSIGLISTGRFYILDADDTTTADDGVNCIISADGFRFILDIIVGIDAVRTERTLTADGDITGLTSDDIVLVNKTTDENTDYNAVASSTLAANELTLKDIKGNASTHRLRFVPNGSEKVDGADFFEIDRDHGFVSVRKKTGGWYVISSSE